MKLKSSQVSEMAINFLLTILIKKCEVWDCGRELIPYLLSSERGFSLNFGTE